MKAMQILLLGATFVVSSAYANEVEKDISNRQHKNIVVAGNLNNERIFFVEQQAVSVTPENINNVHNVLNTKFLNKRPYGKINFD